MVNDILAWSFTPEAKALADVAFGVAISWSVIALLFRINKEVRK